MPTEIERNQDIVLAYLFDLANKMKGHEYISAKAIQEATGLEPFKLNQAVELLKTNGLIEWLQTMDSAPYTFYAVMLTSRGVYEFQRRQELRNSMKTTATTNVSPEAAAQELLSLFTKRKPPIPEGSPYGFTDRDWEIVSGWKANKNILCVVFGCKFDSEYCNYEELRKNIKNMFEQAVQRYNNDNVGSNVSLRFEPLHAGYGEHLFNEIARDIISSDIAIFETSDMAPNIFIEIGVALTWGSRVFLIKDEKRPPPPSDISGQTYADYHDDGKTFVDPQHPEKLYRMVERAIRKKG
jgi:hypothetical protein